MNRTTLMACCVLGGVWVARTPAAHAHSASDAYLTLTADAQTPGQRPVTMLHGQWDIAIRDLQFVLNLDDDGDGRVTWGEVQRHRAAIEAYAYQYLKIGARPAHPCAIVPKRLMIDDHADGAYAALFFDARCTSPVPRVIVNYSLFFKIDPSHRGIFVFNGGGNVATALLSPDNARLDLGR